MLRSHFYEFRLVFSPHTLWFFEPPLFYTPARKLEFYLPWSATYFPWYSLYLGALKKKKEKSTWRKKAITFCPILFGRQFFLSYKKIMFVQNFSLHRPLFSATVGATIARPWDWRKKKRKMEIFHSFFFF